MRQRLRWPHFIFCQYQYKISVTRTCHMRYTLVLHASHVRVTLVTRTCDTK